MQALPSLCSPSLPLARKVASHVYPEGAFWVSSHSGIVGMKKSELAKAALQCLAARGVVAGNCCSLH